MTVSRADGIRPYSGDRCPQVLTTQYHAELRIAGCQFLRKVGNSGILCETRREVLHARERTLVRDRTGTVLTTPYRAKLRIILLNCEKPCRARREVLRTRERTSVRDQVLRFSQRRIARNYALPDISRCLRERRCSSPQCIPHHCRAERRRHPAEPEPARLLPCRPSRKSHRT